MTNLIFQQILMLYAAGINGGNLFSLPTPQKRESCTIFGAYAPANDAFYWKSSRKSNAGAFKSFLHQLRSHAAGKTLVLILDNASVHHAKATRSFAEKYPDVKIFFLPTYSPEYNPAEQIWKWIKPLVHAAKTIGGGINELISRFRKILHAKINNRLAKPPEIGLRIWKSIF